MAKCDRGSLNKTGLATFPLRFAKEPDMASTPPRTSDTLSELKNKATNAIEGAADRVERFAVKVADVAHQGREVGENFQEVASNVKGSIDKSMEDQPMATLAFAAALGFILGAVWKS